MLIRNLIMIGEIYQVLCKDWADKKSYITIKDGDKTVMNKRLVDTREIVEEINDYLLANWGSMRVRIFCTEK